MNIKHEIYSLTMIPSNFQIIILLNYQEMVLFCHVSEIMVPVECGAHSVEDIQTRVIQIPALIFITIC